MKIVPDSRSRIDLAKKMAADRMPNETAEGGGAKSEAWKAIWRAGAQPADVGAAAMWFLRERKTVFFEVFCIPHLHDARKFVKFDPG